MKLNRLNPWLGDASQIYLTYTPVPAPGTSLLAGLGLVSMLRRRRI